jgi:hypothetical protein
MNIYYVYAYLRNKSSQIAEIGTPYYIGKGKNNRAYQKHRTGSRGISLPLDKSNIVILERNLTEVGALALERRMIRWYGRKDLGTGILLNLTDGGDGAPNVIITENKRLKLQAAARHRPPLSAETREKIGRKHAGMKKFSEEQKIEMSSNRALCRWWNNGIIQFFVPTPPDSSFIRGRLPFNNIGAKIGSDINKEKRWWTNGSTQVFSKGCPNEEFRPGRK